MNRERIEGAAREVAGKAQQTVGDLVGDEGTEAKGLIQEARGTAENLYGRAKETVQSVAATAADQASDLGQKYAGRAADLGQDYASRAADVGQRYYREGSRAVTSQVGDQTMAAILVAGAAGYLLAYLIHGRR